MAARKLGNEQAKHINAALARGEGLRAAATIRQRVAAAVQDSHLRAATKKTTQIMSNGRLKAAADTGDWESMRNHGHETRQRIVNNLDALLRQFAANVEAAGGHVHFAADAADVVRYVSEVARSHGVKNVVKSKSMVSEEVELNQALQEAGARVVETDLGEYIIQLAGVRPSHLIAPALHMDRGRIADLFSAEAGRSIPTDTPTLTAYARARLRAEFLGADMGITGCNFGVAETGTVVLVTNEGNGRMVTTVPRVQVTLMGMERLVGTWEELDALLDLLPRAATGQKLSTYVSMITGPRHEGELDGPKELHVVIVDNGRSRLLGSEFQAALHCIRCGACQNVCPVYREIGGHAYGWVYGGPIGAVLTPLYQDWKQWNDVSYACSVCGACQEACPVQVPLPDLLVAIRRRAVVSEDQPQGQQLPVFAERAGKAAHTVRPARAETTPVAKTLERWAFGGYALVMSRPGLWRAALPLARVLQKPLVHKGAISKAPSVLGEWTAGRDLPALPKRTFRELWSSGEVEKQTRPAAPIADTGRKREALP